MSSVFKNAIRANPDVSHWNTSNVLHFTSVFEGAASAIPDVTNWNTDLVKDMSFMFSGAVLANPNMENWNFSSVEKFNSPAGTLAYGFTDMFKDVTLPANAYDKFLIQVSRQFQLLQSGRSHRPKQFDKHPELDHNRQWQHQLQQQIYYPHLSKHCQSGL